MGGAVDDVGVVSVLHPGETVWVGSAGDTAGIADVGVVPASGTGDEGCTVPLGWAGAWRTLISQALVHLKKESPNRPFQVYLHGVP